MRKIKTLLLVCVLLLFCGFAYGEELTFKGTWKHVSDSDPKPTIEFTEDLENSQFIDYRSTIKMDTVMVIIYFSNSEQIVIIDDDDYGSSAGTAYALSRTVGTAGEVSGTWTTSVDNIDDMTLTLSEDNTYTLVFDDEDVDPDNPDDEDDSPSDLCFIGALR